MSIVYIDNDFRCHLTNDGSMRPVETDFFDGKCAAFIEGYRFVPSGESWTRDDGAVFAGQMITPAEDYHALAKAQAQYESDDSKRLAELGIPLENGFTASRNYPVESFLGIYGDLYEVIAAIPCNTSIIPGQNVIKTTVEHYLDTLKEGE